MSTTCHSEYGKIKSIFLRSVKNSWISDEKLIAEWEDLKFLSLPQLSSAEDEYSFFSDIIEDHSAEILHFNKDQDLTLDALYCRDASIATDFGMIICRMGKQNRQGEPESQLNSFIENNIPILGKIQSPGTLEGGDVTWISEKTLVVGRSYRTNKDGIEQLQSLLKPHDIDVIVTDLPHYRGPNDVFHLMSILSPIDKDLAVVYSPLMPISLREELSARGFEFVEVPEEEFDSQGCNVLALAPRKCLVVSGNPLTRHLLIEKGVEIVEYSGEEISVKGGGGPTCLTRPIKREV